MNPLTISSPMLSSSTQPTDARWPRILSEQLVTIAEPLTVALEPEREAPAREVICAAARALLDRSVMESPQQWPAWLAPHQIPAAERLNTILARYGGALLADAVGLGKSYVALAVALARREPFVFVVPAVLVSQWRGLLDRFAAHDVPIVTHEALSTGLRRLPPSSAAFRRLLIVDEAHRFRNPETNRYRALARMAIGARVLLVTATPVHNRMADLFHLFRLFLRDHALAALGVPSLRRAAHGEIETPLCTAAAARLIVARSRDRVRTGYDAGPMPLTFPARGADQSLRTSPAPDSLIEQIVTGVRRLQAGGAAAPLLRLLLLRRLASSLPAFRASLERHDAFLDLAARAGAEGRVLSPREFQRCFPRAADPEVQLMLFPVLLEPGTGAEWEADRRELARLRGLVAGNGVADLKAAALAQLLDRDRQKTIVFTDAQATVRHLLQMLRPRRVAAVTGATARFAIGDARRNEVLRAFAPVAQNAAAPPRALQTDVLIATDLVSEGLNLQDASRVVHYDLPWSPARLAQREGRIDRLGSPHGAITTVTFLPPEPLVAALELEHRLLTKARAQAVAGSDGQLDWCDQLADLDRRAIQSASLGGCGAVAGSRNAAVLIVRIGALIEAIVVDAGVARAGAPAATRLLVESWAAERISIDRLALQQEIDLAIPLIRARLAAVQDARWRASDRDRLARRLIPWVLSAAQRAARRGDGNQLRALDSLVSRLALGMTSGEEFLLEDLLSRREPLAVTDLIAWHARLPPADDQDLGVGVELVAALQTRG